MNENVVRKLDFSRKVVLSVAGLSAVALPIIVGLVTGTSGQAAAQIENTAPFTHEFGTVSIKPIPRAGGTESTGVFHSKVKIVFTPVGFNATGATLQMLIGEAYGVIDNQISGGPNWLNSEEYEIAARVDNSTEGGLGKLSEVQRKLAQKHMLQALLVDRFNLRLHREDKELPVYSLVVEENGAKVRQSKPGEVYPNGFAGPERGGAGMIKLTMDGKIGQLTGQGVPVVSLAQALSQRLGHNVVDKTGLSGNFDFTLRWPTTEGLIAVNGAEDHNHASESSTTSKSFELSLRRAVKEQLGLELQSQDMPVEILVIDQAERPLEQ